MGTFMIHLFGVLKPLGFIHGDIHISIYLNNNQSHHIQSLDNGCHQTIEIEMSIAIDGIHILGIIIDQH